MSRRPLDAFAADLGGFLATAVAFGLAIGVWRLTALGPAPKGGDADASGPASSGSAPPATASGTRAAIADAAPPAPKRSRRTWNVVLITVDTLRFDIGFMGYPRPTTPNIDALASRSVVFERAYATASFTPKCLGPMLIGRYVSETHRDYEHYTNFYPANVFLAERVQSAGGHTVGVASHRYFGWKKGFDQGFDVWDTSSIPPNSPDNDPTLTSEKVTGAAIALLSSERASEIPVRPRRSLPSREGPAKGRFFAWLHYIDPHLPYVFHEGAPSFAAMPGPRERAAYDGDVWYTDKHVGRLLAHIAAQPWAADTAILLTSDHGEAFGEHGHWGHGRELWEPLVRVPLLLYVPGTPTRRVAVKRSHIDVVPTVLELMGIAPDPSLHGRSLVADTIAPPDEIEDRDVFIDMPEGPFNEMRRAVIFGPAPGTKLMELSRGRRLLFDLKEDPNETKDLTGDRARLAEANQAMSRARSSIKELPPVR